MRCGGVAQIVKAYPLVRFFAKHALETMTSAPVSVDVAKPCAEVAMEAKRWLDTRAQ